MFLIVLLTGKVGIITEWRLILNYAKENTDELRLEENNITDVKEATEKLIELAGNNTKFEGMRCGVENNAVFGTFTNISLVRFVAR